MNPTTTEAPRQTNSEAEPRPESGAGVGYEFHPLPKEITRRADLSDGAKILFTFLLNDAGFRAGGRISRARNDRITRECGCSESSLPRKFKELEKAGLIQRETKPVGPKRRDRTGIRITWKPAGSGLQNVEARPTKVVGDRPTHSGRIKEPETKEQEKELFNCPPPPKSSASSSGHGGEGVGSVFADWDSIERIGDPKEQFVASCVKMFGESARARATEFAEIPNPLVLEHAIRSGRENNAQRLSYVEAAARTWSITLGLPIQPPAYRPAKAPESPQTAAPAVETQIPAPSPAVIAAKAANPPREAPKAVETPIPSSEAPESLAGDPRAVAEQEPPKATAEQNQAVDQVAKAPRVEVGDDEYRPAWSPAQPDPDEEASYLAMLGRAPASIEAAELEPVAAC